MNQFKPDDSHDHKAFLFSDEAIQKFKSRSDIPFIVVKDKDLARIKAMLEEAREHGKNLIYNQQNAIQAVAAATSELEATAALMGLIPLVPIGMVVCPTCLDKAILNCEDNLEALKGIREALKCHA